MPTSDAPLLPRLLLASLFILSACNGGDAPDNVAHDSSPTAAAAAAPPISCARGDAPLAPVCTAERAATDAGTLLTLHHPDGGFRRLLVSMDGRDIAAADGAEPATVTRDADGVDVTIGKDRYRLPVIGASAPGR